MTPDTAPEPLAQFTITELWEEICRRSDGAILVWTVEKTKSNQPLHAKIHGTLTTCLGLAEFVKACLVRDLLDSPDIGENG